MFSRVFNGRISLSGTSEEHVCYLDAYVFLLGIVLPMIGYRWIFHEGLSKVVLGERAGSSVGNSS